MLKKSNISEEYIDIKKNKDGGQKSYKRRHILAERCNLSVIGSKKS